MYAVTHWNDADRAEKCGRLRAYLDAHALEEIWLATDSNFGWLLGGDNLVDRALRQGVAAIRFDGESIEIVTNTIEADRIREEEIGEGIRIVAHEWFANDLSSVIESESQNAAAADIPVAGLAPVDSTDFRLPLTTYEIERFRALGQSVGEALEACCRAIEPEDTELDVAADVAKRLGTRGIDAPVRLVGGGQRSRTYRHFTPTMAQIGEYATVAVSARQAGRWVSATRMVAFDPPAWLSERHIAAAQVETSAIAATQAHMGSGSAGDVFTTIQEAYESVGHAGEWKYHHQGGASGYRSREWIATPNHPATIEGPLVVAWNPTISGAKSEDSVLVTDNEVEVVTQTGEWPQISVQSIGESVTLDRPTILEK